MSPFYFLAPIQLVVFIEASRAFYSAEAFRQAINKLFFEKITGLH